MPKVTVTLDVEVDPIWIEFCTSKYVDVFIYGYCGYWMCGMEHNDTLGWLCYEYDWGGDEPQPIDQVRESPQYPAIVKSWEAGETLPPHWFRLNEELAIKAWAEGVKKYGINWFEDGDANTYDNVLQLTLLGELVYG